MANNTETDHLPISQQDHMKPHQYDAVKRSFTNFNEDLFLKVLEEKEKKPCTECNGTGHYFNNEWIYEYDYYGSRAYSCLVCKGTGKVKI